MRVAPRSVSSDADDAAFLSAGYGLTPDGWQEDILDDWLGRRRDGRWSATKCGLCVPRQNGKNALIEIRELFGMVALGEKFLHTAHEVKTARKAFLRISSFFENVRQYPELAALVREIRKTNGQEAIVLTNGGSCEFIARSKGSGRGFTVDVLVCDEAQDLTDEELAALLPTISAAPQGNPQLILTGTPPDPEKGQQGEVLARLRADGESRRDKHLAWTDYGAPDGPLPDITDRAKWVEWNPGIESGRLTIARIEELEFGVMSPERFAAERGGWWGDPSAATSSAFGPGVWESREQPAEPVVDAIGISVAWGGGSASIGAAGLTDGVAVVGAIDQRDGVGWVVAEAKRIQSERGCLVAIDGHGPAADLIPALVAAGLEVDVTLIVLKTENVKDACAQIHTRVIEGQLVHPAHPFLDGAVAGARKRDVGDSGRWMWGRKISTGNIAMLESVTNALWVASTAEPAKPPREFWGAIG